MESLSENTRRANIPAIKSFFGVDNLYDIYYEDLYSVTRRDILKFKLKLLTKGYKISTVKRIISAIKHFYSYLVNQYDFDYNPFDEVIGVNNKPYQEEYTIKESDKVFDVFNEYKVPYSVGTEVEIGDEGMKGIINETNYDEDDRIYYTIELTNLGEQGYTIIEFEEGVEEVLTIEEVRECDFPFWCYHEDVRPTIPKALLH